MKSFLSQDFLDSFNYVTWNINDVLKDTSQFAEPEYEHETYDDYEKLKISTFGFHKSDVELTLDNGVLNIKMSKNEDNNVKSKSLSFKGVNIFKDQITARHKDNVLTITIPKTKQKSSDNTIPIE